MLERRAKSYFDRRIRNNFLESFVEVFELSFNRFVKQPINVEFHVLFLIFRSHRFVCAIGLNTNVLEITRTWKKATRSS